MRVVACPWPTVKTRNQGRRTIGRCAMSTVAHPENYVASSSNGIAGDRIRSFVERVEHIEGEVKALNEGKKEVFAEASGEGFDVKVLKEILKIRKEDADKREEREATVDLYMQAMERASN